MKNKITSMRKFLMPEVVFGKDARLLAGQYCKKFNAARVLIVTDKNIINAGYAKEIIESLDNENIQSFVYSNVSPNPRDSEVMQGVDFYLSNNCDCIVSVGGGSPMDCAKGIGIVALNGKHILDYEGINKINIPLPPLIFIPATAGTSSDVSQFSIILNTKELVKIAIISKIIIPDIALIDYETTFTMDHYLTACTGMDAITHAIEAYVSKVNSPLTDLHALKAIETINSYLPKLINDLSNQNLREKLMFASMEAGFAFSNAFLGAVHAMAHSLGGYLDLPHGECNSLLLHHVINYNFDAEPDRFKKITEALNIPINGLNSTEIKNKLFSHIQSLKNNVGIKNTLKDVGVSSSDISILAKKAYNDACLITNPKPASQKDLEVIYEEAL